MDVLRPEKTRLVHGEILDRLQYPPACPFNTTRAGRTLKILRSMGLFDDSVPWMVAPGAVDRAFVERFHTPAYLDLLRSASQGAARGAFDPRWIEIGLGRDDCPVFADLHDYAMAACGASVTAAALVLSGEADIAFNPSGGYHHAQPDRAAGFCYVNDVVLACLTLLDAGKRVVYLDLDVHHGDGVQDAFYGRSDVMTVDLHESGETLFPGTGAVEEIGEGEGEGYTVNLPFPAGAYDRIWLRALREVALPLIRAYKPDVIVLELGLDALKGDPLAHLELTNNAYAEALEDVLQLSHPVVAVGGGGYHVENTARGWALLWSVLVGKAPAPDLAIGLGGVFLGSSEWLGGLRDPEHLPPLEQRKEVDARVVDTLAKAKRLLFPRHGL